MKQGRALILAACTAMLVFASAPASASAAVRDCPGVAERVYSSYGKLSVRNMSCASAASKLRQAALNHLRLPGWSCRAYETEYEGGYYRCVSGAKAFRWHYGV